jgi:hypothetical protein
MCSSRNTHSSMWRSAGDYVRRRTGMYRRNHVRSDNDSLSGGSHPAVVLGR